MENWNKVPLGEVLNYEQPTKYLVETTNYNHSYETPVLTAGKSFILGYTNEKKGIFTNVPAIIFDDFTTAFHYVDFPFKVKSSAMKILKADNEKADLRFLYYKMSTISLDTDLHKRYWISKFSKVQIQLPPIETQKGISQILDDAAVLRLKTEQLLKEYDLLQESIFLDMFGDPVSNPKGWKILQLGQIMSFLTSGSRGWAKYYSDTGSVFLRIQNIGYNKLTVKNLTFVNAPDNAEYKRTKVKAGDIILSITADLGRTAVIPKDFPIANINQHLAIIRLKEDYNPHYISAYIASEGGQHQFHRLDKGGVKAGLNFTDIKSFKIFTPPIELQNQFAEKIALIEKQKELAKLELKESEDLFNCLLQKAFKGELV